MWHGAVALDANLLVPIVACDFLLTVFDYHLFEDFPHVDPSGLRRRVEFMKLALAEQTIDATTVVGVPELINAKDRHVVAAAMAAEATCVVTNDEALRASLPFLLRRFLRGPRPRRPTLWLLRGGGSIGP